MTRVLIVEDEPTLCDAYQLILKALHEKNKIGHYESTICNNYKEALIAIEEYVKFKTYPDLCLLDYRLGKKDSTENKNGMLLGQIIRKHFPKSKIVLITSISQKYLYYSIINALRPSGFLIKNETSFESLGNDLISILEGKMVYSKTINEFVKKGSYKEFDLDSKDLEILYFLSCGLTLEEIAQKMCLSLSGIEYKKRRIGEKLGAPSSSIKQILETAQKELNLL